MREISIPFRRFLIVFLQHCLPLPGILNISRFGHRRSASLAGFNGPNELLALGIHPPLGGSQARNEPAGRDEVITFFAAFLASLFFNADRAALRGLDSYAASPFLSLDITHVTASFRIRVAPHTPIPLPEGSFLAFDPPGGG